MNGTQERVVFCSLYSTPLDRITFCGSKPRVRQGCWWYKKHENNKWHSRPVRWCKECQSHEERHMCSIFPRHAPRKASLDHKSKAGIPYEILNIQNSPNWPQWWSKINCFHRWKKMILLSLKKLQFLSDCIAQQPLGLISWYSWRAAIKSRSHLPFFSVFSHFADQAINWKIIVN